MIILLDSGEGVGKTTLVRALEAQGCHLILMDPQVRMCIAKVRTHKFNRVQNWTNYSSYRQQLSDLASAWSFMLRNIPKYNSHTYVLDRSPITTLAVNVLRFDEDAYQGNMIQSVYRAFRNSLFERAYTPHKILSLIPTRDFDLVRQDLSVRSEKPSVTTLSHFGSFEQELSMYDQAQRLASLWATDLGVDLTSCKLELSTDYEINAQNVLNALRK